MSDPIEPAIIDLAEIAVIIIEECSGVPRPSDDPAACLDALEDESVCDHALEAGRRILRYIVDCIPGSELYENHSKN